MVDYNINHHIQKYIIGVLYRRKIARFRDLKKQNVDSNLFAYHLKLLQKNNFVKKVSGGYVLSEEGLRYVDRVSETDMNLRIQPKIITMLVLQNSDGNVLLQKRMKQPFIDSLTLPHGKLHIEDVSIKAAVIREAYEKIQITDIEPVHAGDCYVRVMSGIETITLTFAHIFKCKKDNIENNDNQIWINPRELSDYCLAPAVEKIIARTFFNDPYFFEEYIEEYR